MRDRAYPLALALISDIATTQRRARYLDLEETPLTLALDFGHSHNYNRKQRGDRDRAGAISHIVCVNDHQAKEAVLRAIEIVEESGPDSALKLSDLPEPSGAGWLSPRGPSSHGPSSRDPSSHDPSPRDPSPRDESGQAQAITVEVHAAGVSFPELLQTRGLYQIKPPLPFVPGSEVAGIVLSAPQEATLRPGDRVAAFCGLGGFAETAIAPSHLTFALPAQLDFAQGAGLILNYHTAYFALALRGRLQAGETVLVQGAAGGVGTASLQVAKGLGARTIALVSSERKREVASEAGADHTVLVGESWKDEVKELSGGGVEVVLDPVGGDRFTDSLRCLREEGRLVVVGFAGGSIPEVRVNRLLLNNIEVIGAGWGAYALAKPKLCREIGAALDSMIVAGHVKPIVGARFPLDRTVEALKLLEGRGALGKIVLEVREDG